MVRSGAALITDVSRFVKNSVITEFLRWIRKDLLREVFLCLSFEVSLNGAQPCCVGYRCQQIREKLGKH